MTDDGTWGVPPDLELELEKGVQILFPTPGQVRIRTAGEWFSADARTLSILEAFQHARPFREVVEELGARSHGAHDWMECVNTILWLYRNGVLRRTDEVGSAFPLGTVGFDSPVVHTVMLNDELRVQAYIDAIEEVVQPNHVVVDIGTGTGVLALAAARAGARRVYAIEATSMLRRAKDVFEWNGVAEQVVPIAGWSTRVDLPERADVVVSETFGSDPLEEKAREILDDAVRRFLAPGGVVIPHALVVYLLPVMLPPRFRDRYLFTNANLDAWNRAYGMDFAPLQDATAKRLFRLNIRPHRTREWTALAKPVRLASFALAEGGAEPIEIVTQFEIGRDGDVGGILLYFDLQLSASVSMSTRPDAANERCSWRNPVWIADRPWSVKKGDRFELVYRSFFDAERAQVEFAPLA